MGDADILRPLRVDSVFLSLPDFRDLSCFTKFCQVLNVPSPRILISVVSQFFSTIDMEDCNLTQLSYGNSSDDFFNRAGNLGLFGDCEREVPGKESCLCFHCISLGYPDHHYCTRFLLSGGKAEAYRVPLRTGIYPYSHCCSDRGRHRVQYVKEF